MKKMKKQKLVIAIAGLGLFLVVLTVAALLGLKTKTNPKLVSPVFQMAQNEEVEKAKSISYYIVTSQEFLNRARSQANNDQEQTLEEKKAIIDQVEKALAVINQGIQAYPQDDRAFAQRANIYQSLSSFVAEANKYAIQDLNQAISLSSKNPDYYRQLAVLYQNSGLFEGAASAYFNAFRLSPNDNQNLYNLAFALEKSGQIDKAVYYYTKLISLLPADDKTLNAIQSQKENLEKLLVNSKLEHLSDPNLEMVPKKPPDSPSLILGTEGLPLEQARQIFQKNLGGQASSVNQLIIASPEEKTIPASSTDKIDTNAKTGQEILPAGQTEIKIFNQHVTQDKQIIIVPISDTQNKVLYLISKKAGGNTSEVKPSPANEDTSEVNLGWFKVGLDAPINQGIEFNWWIVD